MTKKSLKELMEDAGTTSGAIAATNNGFASGGIGMIRRIPKKKKSIKERMLEAEQAEKEALEEAKNSAQQAAIAIAKKKKQGLDEMDSQGYTGSRDHKSKSTYGRRDRDEDSNGPDVHLGPDHIVKPGKMARQALDVLNKKLDDELTEAPIEIDRDEPTNPLIYGHNKANPAKLQYRMVRAARQLNDLAERVNRAQESNSLQMWQNIIANFSELAMNVDQIGHALEELEKTRRKGGTNSRGIPDLS